MVCCSGRVETNSNWPWRPTVVRVHVVVLLLLSLMVTFCARPVEDLTAATSKSRARASGRSNELPKWRMRRQCPRPRIGDWDGDRRHRAASDRGGTRDAFKSKKDGERVFVEGPGREGEQLMDAGESETAGNFGRRSYWEESYANACGSGRRDVEGSSSFSWYCTWQDLEPFWRELVPPNGNDGPRILIPGIGNDPIVRDMHDAGYAHLSAFDYAPAAVDCARSLLGEGRLRGGSSPGDGGGADSSGVRLDVADARDLRGLYDDATFDAVLDKGTLDAVFLIGGRDKGAARAHVRSAVEEIHRVVRPGGVVVSVTGVDGATAAIDEAFLQDGGRLWTKVRDTREGVYFTEEDGYASININATMLAWMRSADYM